MLTLQRRTENSEKDNEHLNSNENMTRFKSVKKKNQRHSQ